jgi:hypothetical protein
MRFFLFTVGLSPQLFVSFIYLALNQHLTRMCQLRDWRNLSASRQPLRVSNPELGSRQISTYWLSLPYRYSIPQLVSSIILGWLVSNSLFLFRYQFLDDFGKNASGCLAIEDYIRRDQYGYYYVIHSSGLAVLCSLTFGAFILVVLLAIGFQKCRPGPPLGASNSFVIAAACHPPENDHDAGRKLVQWGVIQTDNTNRMVKHCTITSRKVESPVEGQEYA